MKKLTKILVIVMWVIVIPILVIVLATSGIKITFKDVLGGLFAGCVLVFVLYCILIPFNINRIRKNTEK